MDSTAVSMALYAVMISTGRSGERERERASRSSPSTFGMRRSVTSASMFSVFRISAAALPEPTATASKSRSHRLSAKVRAISKLSSTTRTRGFSGMDGFLTGRKLDAGLGSVRLHGFEAERASVARDDFLDDGEANAGALSAGLSREERLEHTVGIGNSRAVIDDVDLQIAMRRVSAHLDGAGARAGNLQIDQQVDDRVFEQARIAVHHRKGGRHVGGELHVGLRK